MTDLIAKLKGEIIEQLNLEDVSVEDIGDEEPLFGEGLGLDSIDALELIVLLERKYGIKIRNAEEGEKVFYSVKTMSDYIKQNEADA